MSEEKVLPFRPVVHNSGREPALSDQELIRVREMMKHFDKIASHTGCPIADRIVHGREG